MILKVVFVDVGGTLGSVDKHRVLHVYGDSVTWVTSLRNGLGLRVGVISNLPADMTTRALVAMLTQGGFGSLIAPELIVTNHDAGAEKPDPRVYAFAVNLAAVQPGECLYIGENSAEVEGGS